MFLTNSTGFRGESIGNQWDINRLPPRIPGEFILDCMKTRFIEHTQDSIGKSSKSIGKSRDSLTYARTVLKSNDIQ